jgi:hypothetical protein
MSQRFGSIRGQVLVTSFVLGAVISACASSPEVATGPSSPSPTADATATPRSEPPATATAPEASASPPASPSAASLVIPKEIPCDAIDLAVVEGIIGGSIATEREWEPGDQPFGDSVPPSSNFGCQYLVEGPQGSVPEFGLTLLGRDLTEDQWEEMFSSSTNCRELEASADLLGDQVVAEVCASGTEGFSNLTMRGLFGSTGVVCGAYLPDELIDPAVEAAAIGECARIIAELSS